MQADSARDHYRTRTSFASGCLPDTAAPGESTCAEGLASAPAQAADAETRHGALTLLAAGLQAPVEAFDSAMRSIHNQRMWDDAEAINGSLAALDKALAGNDLDEALTQVGAIRAGARKYLENECKATAQPTTPKETPAKKK